MKLIVFEMSLSPFCDSRISLFEYNTLFNSVVEKFIQDCQPTGNQGNQGKVRGFIFGSKSQGIYLFC